jgi:hypothetical protein
MAGRRRLPTRRRALLAALEREHRLVFAAWLDAGGMHASDPIADAHLRVLGDLDEAAARTSLRRWAPPSWSWWLMPAAAGCST